MFCPLSVFSSNGWPYHCGRTDTTMPIGSICIKQDTTYTSHCTLCCQGTSVRYGSTAPTAGATGTCAAHTELKSRRQGPLPGARNYTQTPQRRRAGTPCVSCLRRLGCTSKSTCGTIEANHHQQPLYVCVCVCLQVLVVLSLIGRLQAALALYFCGTPVDVCRLFRTGVVCRCVCWNAAVVVHGSLSPLVVESYGRQCSATHTLLNLLGRLAADSGRVSKGAWVEGALQQLSIALCKGNYFLFQANLHAFCWAAGKHPTRGTAVPHTIKL